MKQYQKSTFKYWLAHWSAYQMTALNLGCWKFKFLLHDIDKPIMLFLFRNYKFINGLHKKYAAHHNDDYLAMIIDWECSRLTKADSPLTARETMVSIHPELKPVLEPILQKLKL